MASSREIVTVVGARPQFIKAAAVSRIISQTDGLKEMLLHTGQHFDANMSDVFFQELGIPEPGVNLGIGSLSHGAMTGRQLEKIEQVLLERRPAAMLVYGDTNSTLAGALAAAKLGIPVAHVEAGLRSWNRAMPEEVNRVLTDHVSDMLFPPTRDATQNLAAEGITQNVFEVGDVMLDTARFVAQMADARSSILERLSLMDKRFRLCTLHRQENTDDLSRLEAIFSALRRFAAEASLVLPLHPRTKKVLRANGTFDAWTKGLTIIDPVGFVDIVALLQGAEMVVTDSGGLQKEAYFHNSPVLILRDETEWTDLLRLGWARLAKPISDDAIVDAAEQLLGQERNTSEAPYGDGHAAEKIVAHLKDLTQ